jgi:hypothetical protein
MSSLYLKTGPLAREAPRLWALAAEMAERVGTRPVDAVYGGFHRIFLVIAQPTITQVRKATAKQIDLGIRRPFGLKVALKPAGG